MSKQQRESLQLGGPPRVDLLPPSVKEAIRRRPIVRRLVILVGAIALATVLVVAGATVYSISAKQALANEQARTTTLLDQQLEFAEARAVSGAVDETLRAQSVATGTEADWQALLAEIRGTLPDGVLLTAVTGAIRATESEDEIPLRQDSVGSFTIEAISDTVPNVEAWIAELESITGYAGIAPPVTVSGSEGAVYSVSIEVLLDSDVFLGRYAPESDSAEEEEG